MAHSSPWDKLPFEFNQPIERYRRYHMMDLDAFAAWLELTPDEYIGVVAGDPVTLDNQRWIAHRLKVPYWLINECIPPPTPEEVARVQAIVDEIDRLGYVYEIDLETGESRQVPWEPSPVNSERVSHPGASVRRADALLKLEHVHAAEPDQDYPRLRHAIEQRIRTLLNLAPDARFDTDAWAREVLEIPLEFWPRKPD